MEDPYKTLGVPKDASQDEIRKAYRKLAKTHHPDLNPGNKKAEEIFKTVSAANELLSDPESRGRYDRGEIDGTGAEKPQARSYRHYAEADQSGRYGGGAPFNAGPADFDDIFSMFRNQAGGAGRHQANGSGPAKGRDEHYVLTAAFLDAVNGATRRLTLPDGQTLDVKIPPGTTEGSLLRLRGRGGAGRNNGPAGDALIEIHIEPHPFFHRDGQNIHLDLPVTYAEAILGAKVTVPTPAGPVALTIKPRAEAGQELRLRGRGVPAHGSTPAGDLLVKLTIVTGGADEALESFLRSWKPQNPINPRAAMEGA